MQVISVGDLSRLTRAQLFSLLTQFQATLADLVPDSAEHRFASAMLANIRLALSRKAPSPRGRSGARADGKVRSARPTFGNVQATRAAA